jgi:integrase
MKQDSTTCSQILTPARPYTNVGKAFGAACSEAGIQDLTFHDLRHTFASRLREAGVDGITRRDLLGHSTVEMSDDYTHSSAESRLRAVQSIADYRKQDYSKFTKIRIRRLLFGSRVSCKSLKRKPEGW